MEQNEHPAHFADKGLIKAASWDSYCLYADDAKYVGYLEATEAITSQIVRILDEEIDDVSKLDALKQFVVGRKEMIAYATDQEASEINAFHHRKTKNLLIS